MKYMRTNYIIMTIVSSMAFVSCNYLDFDETDGLKDKDDIYEYFNSTEQMLTHVYSYMPQDFGTIDNAMRDCASDDAIFGYSGGTVQRFNDGSWSAIKTADTAWKLYEGIRAANSFIQDVANVDLSRYEHDGNYNKWMTKLKCFPYEAKVLRAHYFFELARRYGDIAMPLIPLTIEEANAIGKTPFSEVIDFIVQQCDEAVNANGLPENYNSALYDTQVGRVTKGFAMAVKSKALLYAASKLHNPTMNTELWKKSAKAALDIINLNLYSLDGKEVANNLTSKEVVLFRVNNDNSKFELQNFPIRFTEGSRTTGLLSQCTYPTQNLVDAFQTTKGYTVTLGVDGWVYDENADFDPQDPYNISKRDPRFGRVILANKMSFKESTIQVQEGGVDDVLVSQGGSPTGYFLRKYIQESTSFTPDHLVSNKHHWVIYRYAETLLTYAESMANAFGDKGLDYTDDTYTKSARWAINEVRNNVKMPIITTTNVEAFMKQLQNEWRVEFAFEDHRFWDVRRWKIADTTQRNIYGVKIKEKSGVQEFTKKLCEKRTWKNCMYLFPIPQEELYINTNLNPQNPEW